MPSLDLSSPLTGLTPLEMDWIVNFWQDHPAPPVHLHSSPAFLAIVERVHGHFSNVQAQTEWQFAVTTASSVKALVATRKVAGSNDNHMSMERADSNVGISRNVGRRRLELELRLVAL
ncbi:unnamed protein product [Jaminaea pallidilutea]